MSACQDMCSSLSSKRCLAEQAAMQVSIILGSTGQSYLVGFGSNYPQHVFQVRCVCLDAAEMRWCRTASLQV